MSLSRAAHIFLTFLVGGLIFMLLWWSLDYVRFPQPFDHVMRAILVILAIAVIIGFLLRLVKDGISPLGMVILALAMRPGTGHSMSPEDQRMLDYILVVTSTNLKSAATDEFNSLNTAGRRAYYDEIVETHGPPPPEKVKVVKTPPRVRYVRVQTPQYQTMVRYVWGRQNVPTSQYQMTQMSQYQTSTRRVSQGMPSVYFSQGNRGTVLCGPT
jgi:hypothetical protein